MNCRIAVTPTSTAISTYSAPIEWKNVSVNRLSGHISPVWRLETVAEQVRNLYSMGGAHDLRQFKY